MCFVLNGAIVTYCVVNLLGVIFFAKCLTVKLKNNGLCLHFILNNDVFEIRCSVEDYPIWMFWKRRRYIVGVLAFFGFFNVYSLRVNLSIAIVSMTENKTIVDEFGNTTYVCGIYFLVTSVDCLKSQHSQIVFNYI